MWSGRKSSGTEEFPLPKDLLRFLLTLLIQKQVDGSWAHFEVADKRGYFFNLLSAKAPWIEVAFVDERSLHLNEGVSRRKEELKPPVPGKWAAAGKRLWTVPAEDLSELVEWIDSCLSAASEISNYRATGWLEGL